MDLSISIVSWNTRDLLDACLASVYEATSGIEFEVIVVDNASSDDSAEMVRSKYPQARMIENTGNVGFACANNQAYSVCTGRCFLLLNPDTVVLGDALRKLVSFLDNHDRAGAVGPLVLNADGSLQYSWARFPTLWNEAIGRLDRRIQGVRRVPAVADEVRTLDPYLADWIGGCCLMIKRKAIEEIGLLDESLFMYSEETDWCLRLHKAGWDVWVEPIANIIHIGGRSSDQSAMKTELFLVQSKSVYFKKHVGKPAGLLLGSVLGAKLWLKRLWKPAHMRFT